MSLRSARYLIAVWLFIASLCAMSPFAAAHRVAVTLGEDTLDSNATLEEDVLTFAAPALNTRELRLVHHRIRLPFPIADRTIDLRERFQKNAKADWKIDLPGGRFLIAEWDGVQIELSQDSPDYQVARVVATFSAGVMHREAPWQSYEMRRAYYHVGMVEALKMKPLQRHDIDPNAFFLAVGFQESIEPLPVDVKRVVRNGSSYDLEVVPVLRNYRVRDNQFKVPLSTLRAIPKMSLPDVDAYWIKSRSYYDAEKFLPWLEKKKGSSTFFSCASEIFAQWSLPRLWFQ